MTGRFAVAIAIGLATPPLARADDTGAAVACYVDVDKDGYGSAAFPITSTTGCTSPGESLDAADCDDGDANVHPGATEIPGDGVDEDCDGAELCYVDGDGDRFGGTTVMTGSSLACNGPGESNVETDCNDGDPNVNPAATDAPADGVDQNCDGIDYCYVDHDGDHFGTTETMVSDIHCNGASFNNTDCNDDDSDINPGEIEIIADGIDEDCNNIEVCFEDADHDGYGAFDVITFTTPPSLACNDLGQSTNNLDCNDDDVLVHPGAPEVVADGIDEDCDGTELCYVDADGDTYGGPTTASTPDLTCASPMSAYAQDCNDANRTVLPGVGETCNGVDDNCNGAIDEGLHCAASVPLLGCAAEPGRADIDAAVLAACAFGVLSFRRRRVSE